MADIKKITEEIEKFRNERDWKQFHNFKDMALSLVLEATEVLERFQWKNPKEIDNYLSSNKNEVSGELADVLYWVLLMSHDLQVDILEELKKKMKHNAKKYPIEKAKGKHTKYDQL